MTNLKEKEYIKRENALSYMDLLAMVLTQHEKTLSELIGKLEKTSDELSRLIQEMGSQKKKESNSGVEEKNTEKCTYIS